MALLWRLHMNAPDGRERAETVSLKVVGVSFLALAAYVAYDAVRSSVAREPPEASYVGIGLAALSTAAVAALVSAGLVWLYSLG